MSLNGEQQVCQNDVNDVIEKEEICGVGYKGELGIDITNQRLKILSFEGSNYFDFVTRIKEVAQQKQLGKVLVNAKQERTAALERAGYIREGTIPGYFMGVETFCYSYFTDPSRAKSMYLAKEDEILHGVTGNRDLGKTEELLPANYELREIREADVLNLVDLYKEVFASYPSPLFNPKYIRKVMHEQVYFMAVFDKEGLPVSAGSADMDLVNLNAELTDLATHKKARGLGLATTIIKALEKEMWQRKIKCLYSLSRAGIPGVNRALYKLGYTYQGRLLNNCHIGGKFEDMNIWVKL